MSNLKFCHHCGKKVPLGGNFCPSCGTNLSSLSSTPQTSKPHQQTFEPRIVNPDDEDDDAIDHISHLNIRQNGLQIEIIRDKPLGESMAAVISQGASGPPPDDGFIRAQPYQNVDPKQVIADLAQEGGSMKHGHTTTITVK